MASKRDEQKAWKKLRENTEGYSTLDLEIRSNSALSEPVETVYRAYNEHLDPILSQFFPTPMEAVDDLLKGGKEK
uniref:Uncharacterized protein n=1 Tax=viral metagenome TaxID=1070528 RepID=A0A6M3JWP8_9ZZZZ